MQITQRCPTSDLTLHNEFRKVRSQQKEALLEIKLGKVT